MIKIFEDKMEKGWVNFLSELLEEDETKIIFDKLRNRKAAGAEIYPESKNVFNAFKHCAFNDLKVVIIGQDPYHTPNMAHGLSFSVLPGTKYLPPSLRNILKELDSDLNYDLDQEIKEKELDAPAFWEHPLVALRKTLDYTQRSPCLIDWAEQGVLMLNTALTVEKGVANSHKDIWQTFTQKIVMKLDEKEELIWVLWGDQAQALEPYIYNKDHKIIKSPHPSPFSAYRGFFGSRPFTKVNNFLDEKNKINWVPKPSRRSTNQ